ncbi:MAG: two-component system LytT family response regulator [Saprospiraceae bacterium]|jgi:two-component system LytT family response regulator
MKTNKQYLKAYIIEDELAGFENLSQMLKKYSNNILLIGNAFTIRDVVAEIPAWEPDIVFLDIELPQENGFQLFKYFPNHSLDAIFTTDYSEYAIKAFNYSSIHYILKPIDIDERQRVLEKVNVISKLVTKEEQLAVWKDAIANNLSKIVLPTYEGLHFIDVDDIVWCEAKSNYTHFYVRGQENLLVKRLKVYEDILSTKAFFRANRTSLIYINHIVNCSNHKKMEITMTK